MSRINHGIILSTIVILIVSSFSFFPTFNESPQTKPYDQLIPPEGSLKAPVQETEINDPPLKSRCGSRASRFTEQTAHGGSWLDSFKNESGIDLLLSDNIKITAGNVTLDDTGFVKVLEDNFSSPLDSSKWINNSGNGTTVYTHPELKAVKNDLAQTSHCYIESRQSWNSLRIIEWYWNSVYDSDPKSYGHSMYVFKGPTKDFYFGVQADRTVIVGDAIVYYPYTSPFPIYANQWYKMRMTMNYNNAVLEVKDMSNQIVINTTITSTIFPINEMGSADLTFASKSPATLHSFETRVDNYRLYEKKIYPDGNLTSKPIELPRDMLWDKLVISKSELTNCNIKISILNATSNQPISGYEEITFDGEVDLSGLDKQKYSSIRLKAKFEGNNISTPSLFYWGVSWNVTNSWRDTIFCSNRVSSFDGVKIYDGEVRCGIPRWIKGYLNSSVITIPDKYYYDTLIINKIEPFGTNIEITIKDVLTGNSIAGFEKIFGTEIDISPIDPIKHPIIRLYAYLNCYSGDTAILYDWSLNWTENQRPNEIDLSNDNEIYRTFSTSIDIDIYDSETLWNFLTVELYYKAPTSTEWLSEYISSLNPSETSNLWSAEFIPDATAQLGLYSFKVVCIDAFGANRTEIFKDVIEVKNNLPTKPELGIQPGSPRTTDDLNITAKNSVDIESEEITYLFTWYKNDELQDHFITERIGSGNTSKGEVWRCEVTPYDGDFDGYGPKNSSSVTILNSAPVVIKAFEGFEINEDEIDANSVNLNTTFYDADNDILSYSYHGNKNIEVTIEQQTGKVTLVPKANWFGKEKITFTANDTESDASDTVEVDVIPQNDAPELIKAGAKDVTSPVDILMLDVYESNRINLTLISKDIDGDRVVSSSNRTDFIGMDDISEITLTDIAPYQYLLSFLPDNNHVGYIPVNFTIDDLNGSKVHYRIIIHVHNINNPPWVGIEHPRNGSEYKKGEVVEFTCNYTDIDLLIPENNETLIFTWTSSLDGRLERSEFLTSISTSSLTPGTHTITINVRDSGGLEYEDSITVIIEDKKQAAKDTLNISSSICWIFLIILLIIGVIVTVIMMRRRKRLSAEAEYIPPTAEAPALPETFVAKPGTIAAPTIAMEQVSQPAPPDQLPQRTGDGAPSQVTPSSIAGQVVVQPTEVPTAAPAPPQPAPIPQHQLPPAPEQAPESPEVTETAAKPPESPVAEAAPVEQPVPDTPPESPAPSHEPPAAAQQHPAQPAVTETKISAVQSVVQPQEADMQAAVKSKQKKSEL